MNPVPDTAPAAGSPQPLSLSGAVHWSEVPSYLLQNPPDVPVTPLVFDGTPAEAATPGPSWTPPAASPSAPG